MNIAEFRDQAILLHNAISAIGKLDGHPFDKTVNEFYHYLILKEKNLWGVGESYDLNNMLNSFLNNKE